MLNYNIFHENSNSAVKTYLSQCLRLIASLRIKCNTTANLLNEFVEQKGLVVDHNNKGSWIYFNMLAGLPDARYTYLIDGTPFDILPDGAVEGDAADLAQDAIAAALIKVANTWDYHKLIIGSTVENDAFDIRVNSFDSFDILTGVLFTNATGGLNDNPKTKEMYKVGTVNMTTLLNTYPHLETLLMGVMYPACGVDYPLLPRLNTTADIAAAPDFAILAYDKDLVEEHEDNLIYELQNCIDNFVNRWHNTFYVASSSYYMAGFWITLVKHLYLKLLNIRLANCKTYRAHSFHINTYLAGFYDLDKYVKYMTRKQILFFYKNIEYLSLNVGKTSTFKLLTEKLLTDRQIGLSEISVRQQDVFDANFLPNVNVRRKTLNGVFEQQSSYIEFDYLEELQGGLSKENKNYYADNAGEDKTLFKKANSAIERTKVINCLATDFTNALRRPLEEIVITQWLAWAADDTYPDTVMVLVTDPRDFTQYPLKPLDAYKYFLLLSLAQAGIFPTTMPSIQLNGVYKLPSLNTVLSNVVFKDENVISELYPNSVFNNKIKRVADFIMSRAPNFDSISYPDRVYSNSFLIFNFVFLIEQLIRNEGDVFISAQVKTMGEKFFESNTYDFNNTVSVDDFLTSVGLKTNLVMANADYDLFVKEIVHQATGFFVEDASKLANIQAAMVAIFKKLSSYSVQFITQINEDDLLLDEFSSVGLSEINMSGSGLYMPTIDQTYITTSISYDDLVGPSITSEAPIVDASIDGNILSVVELPITEVTVGIESLFEVANATQIVLEFDYVGRIEDVSNKSPFVGIEYINGLSNLEQSQIKFN